MSLIGSFAQGDWAKGLVEMATGGVGGGMFDVIRGRQSFGEFAAEAGKRAAIEAPIAIATMGAGAAAGAAASGLAKVASGATGVISKVAQGASTALNAVSKVAGTGVQNMSKEAVGQTVKTAAIDSAKNMVGGPALGLLKTAGSKVAGVVKGTPTGAAADIANNSAGYMGNPPSLGGQVSAEGAATGVTPQIQKQTVGAKIKAGVSGTLDKHGAQIGLSLLSTAAGAKQAKASNAVAQQSLQFQQQSYNEAKAEKEAAKAQLKQDALTAYNATQSFAASLADADSNNTLLTGYNTNGTGNEGTYSILSWSSKKSSTT